ncbi:MAG: MBL fold metallo-hydrolase [Oligosphaeraceae bacterium]
MKTGITLLASGSNGNCIAIQSEGRTILVDCGISCKELGERLKVSGIAPESLCALLVTHAHIDHIKGIQRVSQTYGLPIYATRNCFEEIQARIAKNKATKKETPCPLLPRLIEVGYSFACAGFQVTPFPVEHDVETVGYVITTPQVKIGIATDAGKPTNLLETFLRDCHALVLESNYDPDMLLCSNRSWELKHRICGGHGHLSNRQAAELLPRIVTRNTKNVFLAHISEECNRYELAMNAAQEALRNMKREDIFLTYGIREGAIPTIWL